MRPSRRSSTLAYLAQIVRPGIDAVRTLWLAFGLIQAAGLALVLAYFYVPAVARVCDDVGAAKARYGLLGAAIAMPIACGIVPEIFKFVAGVDRTFSRYRLGLMLHNMGIFFIGGMTVDTFYRVLNYALGPSDSTGIVVAKVLLDQLVYTTIIGVPLIAVAYTLRKVGYRPLVALRCLTPRWYLRECGPVMVTCWAYWFPMTTLMYTLPPTLTFVYGTIASAASTLLLTAVAGRSESRLADAHV